MKRFKTVRESTNPHRFVACSRISTSESCLEARFKTIKPRFFHSWVDSSGLGFVREEKRERPVGEKKREKHFEKMKKTGS